MLFYIIVFIIALLAILLSLVILLQSGKGGGLAGIAAGGATQQVLGARQAPDFLEKATWTLATIFIVLCIVSNFFIGGSDTAPSESVIQQQAQGSGTEQVVPDLAPAPAAPLDTEAPATGGSGEEGGSDQ